MDSQPKPNQWLKDRREQLGLSQDDLAKRLQVEGQNYTRATVSHWEVGRYQPPLHEAAFRRALARILKMTIREMLIAAGYEIVPVAHTAAGERAASILDQLPSDQQGLALDILEKFLERV